MGRAIAAAITVSAATLPFAGSGHALRIFWHDVTRHVFVDYRPELHYMRGPGPAWQAKHGSPPSPLSPSRPSSL